MESEGYVFSIYEKYFSDFSLIEGSSGRPIEIFPFIDGPVMWWVVATNQHIHIMCIRDLTQLPLQLETLLVVINKMQSHLTETFTRVYKYHAPC